MTKEQIIEQIQYNTNLKGDNSLVVAQNGFYAAISSLGKIDYVPWNKFYTTDSLTSGTSLYVLGEDLFSDYSNIKGIVSLWRTDEDNRPIRIINPDLFNPIRRGNTDSGEPGLGTIFRNADNQLVLELYYTPDDSYPIWAYLRKPLEFENIDEDFHDLVLYEGVLHVSKVGDGYYEKAIERVMSIKNDLKSVGDLKFSGSLIQPGYRFGEDGQRRDADSKNLFGFR